MNKIGTKYKTPDGSTIESTEEMDVAVVGKIIESPISEILLGKQNVFARTELTEILSDEKKYKLEGERRMKLRKEKRNENYKRLSRIASEVNRSISTVKYGAPWEDSSSPTGWSQICSYQGNCEFPCCGDC